VLARAEVKLKQLNEAHSVLRDPEERARYDAALSVELEEGLHFVSAGSPKIRRSKIKERLAEIKQEITQAKQQIESLKPLLEAAPMLNKRWERYLFVSLILGAPFIFLGGWAEIIIVVNPFSWQAQSVLLLLLLFGYFALFLALKASQTQAHETGLARLLASVPLAILFFVVIVFVPLPRGINVASLILGYMGIVWQGAGQPLSKERNKVLIANSKIKSLEEEIVAYTIEERHLNVELGRS